MKHGSSNRRQRSRGNGGRRNGNQRMQVFDSNGPDVRIRGTAHQVTEKYLALAKDASASGNIVLAESYLQHAEHYQRVINEFTKDVQSAGADRSSSKNEREKPASSDDDLSLPSSILGASSEAKPSGANETRTGELSTA